MKNKAKTTTLPEQFQKLPHCRNSSKNYHMVGTVPNATTLSGQFQNLPHCRNSSENYHTVGTATKQKLPHCRNSNKTKTTTLSEQQQIKNYHTVGTVPKSNIKIVERGQIDTYSTQIQDRSLS